MKCEAWQYNTRLTLARIFYMQLRFFGIVPVLGRDTYVDGKGRMLIRLLDLVAVGDGTGEAYDIGELVTCSGRDRRERWRPAAALHRAAGHRAVGEEMGGGERGAGGEDWARGVGAVPPVKTAG